MPTCVWRVAGSWKPPHIIYPIKSKRRSMFRCTSKVKWYIYITVLPAPHGKGNKCNKSLKLFEAKSRKYQGVFKVKSRVKTWQFEESGLNNWSTSKSHKGERNQVSGRVSVPFWHATPVANECNSSPSNFVCISDFHLLWAFSGILRATTCCNFLFWPLCTWIEQVTLLGIQIETSTNMYTPFLIGLN